MMNLIQKGKSLDSKKAGTCRTFVFTNKMRKSAFLMATFLFAACLLTNEVLAQEQLDISGTVTSNDGEPLPGVTIVVEGTQDGTTTNLDGTYTITASPNDVLSFSYIGFENHRENR